MQDITAQTLNLTRGVKKSEQKTAVKETLNVIEYKAMQEEIRLKTLKEKTAQEEEQRAQAQVKAKEVEQEASEKIKADNKKWHGLATDWEKAFEASERRRERLSAQLIDTDRQMTEYGLKGAFKSFWEDCKRWWTARKLWVISGA